MTYLLKQAFIFMTQLLQDVLILIGTAASLGFYIDLRLSKDKELGYPYFVYRYLMISSIPVVYAHCRKVWNGCLFTFDLIFIHML